MQVSKDILSMSEEILEIFDPERVKQSDISKVQQEESKGNKWDKLEKSIEKEEKLEEI